MSDVVGLSDLRWASFRDALAGRPPVRVDGADSPGLGSSKKRARGVDKAAAKRSSSSTVGFLFPRSRLPK